MLTHWPLSLGQFSCSCCCWENWSPHHDCMLVDTFSPISTLSVNVFWRGDTVRVSPFISEVWLRFTVSPLKLLPARQKTRRYDHRLACEMSGKMQETEIEMSSLLKKISLPFGKWHLLLFWNFFTLSVHQRRPICLLSLISCNDPCTLLQAYYRYYEQARFFCFNATPVLQIWWNITLILQLAVV